MVIHDNILFVYNSASPDSIAVANAYANAYALAPNQFLGLTFSSTDIYVNYLTFKSEVETPVVNYINSISSLRKIYIIILGYNTPNGFQDGSDKISATSRLSAIRTDPNYTSKKIPNPIYNRQVYKAFDSTDGNRVLICSKIDADSKDNALNIISNSFEASLQKYISGTVYFDDYVYYPSSDINGLYNYNQNLKYCLGYVLPNLSLDVYNINNGEKNNYSPTPYYSGYSGYSGDLRELSIVGRLRMPQFSHLDGDSICWCGGHEQGSSDIFGDIASTRYFFYHAGVDSGSYLHDITQRRWLLLALNAGYCGGAAPLSDPQNGNLNPTQFFFDILYKSTMGEAVIFSTPFLNWTINVVGDPFTWVYSDFHNATVLVDADDDYNFGYLTDEVGTWSQLNYLLSSDWAYYLAKIDDAQSGLMDIVDSHDVLTEVDLLYKMYNISQLTNLTIGKSAYIKVLAYLMEYIKSRFINLYNSYSGYSGWNPNYPPDATFGYSGQPGYWEPLSGTITQIPINLFLATQNKKISSLVLDSIANLTTYSGYGLPSFVRYVYGSEAINPDYIYPQGEWELEFPFYQCQYDCTNYYFDINIIDYRTNTFIKKIDSYSGFSGWYYDTMSIDGKTNLQPVSSSGVPYFVDGKNVKYISTPDNYLIRKNLYKFQVKTKYLTAGYSGYNYCSGYSAYSGWAYSPMSEYIKVIYT